MKAVYITEHGAPERLVVGEVPDPEIGPGEVLVRVRACSINRVDLFTREGSHGTRRRGALPRVLGRDVGGEVLRVGEGVEAFRAGDRVLGLVSSGAYAEYAKANPRDLYPLPEELSFEEGSTIPTVFSTAWHLLLCRAHIRLGEDVLIMAAGSGVGVAAIQIAKRAGCRVFATASSHEKLEKARALGADVGINYRERDFKEEVLSLTEGRGVDVVLDHIGAPVWEGCFACLKRGGRFINCGVSAGYRVELHLGQLWTRDLTIMGSSMHPQEDMPDILRLVGSGDLRPVVAQVLPLEEAREAHELLEASRFFGKIVLRP